MSSRLIHIDEVCPHCGAHLFLSASEQNTDEPLRCPDCFRALLILRTGAQRLKSRSRVLVITFAALCMLGLSAPCVVLSTLSLLLAPFEGSLLGGVFSFVLLCMGLAGLFTCGRASWQGLRMWVSLHDTSRVLAPAHRGDDGVMVVTLPQTDARRKRERIMWEGSTQGGLSLQDDSPHTGR